MLKLTLILLLGMTTTTSATFHNAGTPNNVPLSFDCAARTAVYEYGQKLLPRKKHFKTLFDALQLSNGCNKTSPPADDAWLPPKYPTPTTSNILFVDAKASAGGSGTKTDPLATISEAVLESSKSSDSTTILLRSGTHFTDQIQLGPEHSGLTIQNYNGEYATVSGGVPFTLSAGAWTPYKIEKGWSDSLGENNIYGKLATPKTSTSSIKFLGLFDSFAACKAAATNNDIAVTYHQANFDSGQWAKGCYATIKGEGNWSPTPEANVDR